MVCVRTISEWNEQTVWINLNTEYVGWWTKERKKVGGSRYDLTSESIQEAILKGNIKMLAPNHFFHTTSTLITWICLFSLWKTVLMIQMCPRRWYESIEAAPLSETIQLMQYS